MCVWKSSLTEKREMLMCALIFFGRVFFPLSLSFQFEFRVFRNNGILKASKYVMSEPNRTLPSPQNDIESKRETTIYIYIYIPLMYTNSCIKYIYTVRCVCFHSISSVVVCSSTQWATKTRHLLCLSFFLSLSLSLSLDESFSIHVHCFHFIDGNKKAYVIDHAYLPLPFSFIHHFHHTSSYVQGRKSKQPNERMWYTERWRWGKSYMLMSYVFSQEYPTCW